MSRRRFGPKRPDSDRRQRVLRSVDRVDASVATTMAAGVDEGSSSWEFRERPSSDKGLKGLVEHHDDFCKSLLICLGLFDGYPG